MSKFIYVNTGQIFTIRRVIKDFHDYPYIITCNTESGKSLAFMASEFQTLYSKAKIRKINTKN